MSQVRRVRIEPPRLQGLRLLRRQGSSQYRGKVIADHPRKKRLRKSLFSFIFKKIKFFKLFFKKVLHFEKSYDIILKLSKARPVGQAAKTLASHAGNMGSIPVRVTKKEEGATKLLLLLF